MADGSSFPQIPTTVWWGVRALLNKTPNAAITDDLLGVELQVQPAAARQYVTELKRVGLLNENNRATELANKWRMADTYADAVESILRSSYGEGLLTIAPSPADRAKAVDWFQRQGLGEGAAKNKAATYFLLASPEPGESPRRAATGGAPRSRSARKTVSTDKPAVSVPTNDAERGSAQHGGVFPVNLNLQIHISAEATIDQIDAIFESMRKHLGNATLS